MTSTAIDAESICRIIKECARSGVAHLKVQDLTIDFLSSDRTLELPKATQQEFAWARPPKKTAHDKHVEPPKVLLTEEDKEAFRQMEELQLAIDDPLAYEEMQIGEDMDTVSASSAGEVVHGERTEDLGFEPSLSRSGGS